MPKLHTGLIRTRIRAGGQIGRIRKSSAQRKRGGSAAVHANAVEGDAAKVLSPMTLPQGAAVAVIPSSEALEAKLQLAAFGS